MCLADSFVRFMCANWCLCIDTWSRYACMHVFVWFLSFLPFICYPKCSIHLCDSVRVQCIQVLNSCFAWPFTISPFQSWLNNIQNRLSWTSSSFISISSKCPFVNFIAILNLNSIPEVSFECKRIFEIIVLINVKVSNGF